ncbi:uncharacterized protein BT62DRAFT_992060 [Guyanagaster necrorhizus]|uniref:Uncharacterized protein n=1 Tax=Guyanagaster necrorhizus TaxID=856835 RepID=A0A9P7VZX4_9AGAR|nr:uncharacterized protein BT62DRAFT_992060 [Guyanagaster necrorhizus MCA 3950]KAG7450047.1 hypothetical protein BT62DRAFT_992060 [Guyanagaster necrorhizus MCA 3950]
MPPRATPFKKNMPSDVALCMRQELFDYILDFLHDDIPALRTCELASRAFLDRSRYHIYSNVFIVHISELDLFREQYGGQLYHRQNFIALLENSPHVAPLVTRLGIHSRTVLLTNVFMETSLLSIIPSLHNLFHIEFICRGIHEVSDHFPVATYRLFLAALRSVPLKTLILNGFAFETHGNFADLLIAAANPALKHLSLICDDGADWGYTVSPPIRPPPHGLPALESLYMAGDATCENISWLFFDQSLYDISDIRHLQLYYDSKSASPIIQKLLDAMQETLESFTLEVDPWADQASLDLSRHSSLSSYYVILASPLDPLILGTCLSPTLRALTVECVFNQWDHNSRHSVYAWAEFDAHLDELALPALQSVHVRLHNRIHPGRCDSHGCDGSERPTDDWDQWKRQVEESMHLLKGRGVLEVEVVKQHYCIQSIFD